MAEKLGEGKRNSDRRKSGVARRVPHTLHGGDMTGDKREHPYAPSIEKSSESRTVPIAKTVGEAKKPAANGGGTRSVPKAMKVGDW